MSTDNKRKARIYFNLFVIAIAMSISLLSCSKPQNAISQPRGGNPLDSFKNISFASWLKNTVGFPRITFFSTSKQTIYKTYADATPNAADIDICFVLDSTNNNCYMVSPDALNKVHMPSLAGATHTLYGISTIGPIQYETLQNDLLLQMENPTQDTFSVSGANLLSFKNAAGKVGLMNGGGGSSSAGANATYDFKVEQ